MLVFSLTLAIITVLCIPPSRTQISDDEDLVREFRDLLSEFLLGKDCSSPKHIRDTSKIHRRSPETEMKSAHRTVERRIDDKLRLSPLYRCNHFDAESRLCVNVRQLGTTLTIGVRVEGSDAKGGSFPVHWYRVYAVRGRGEQEEQFSFVELNRDNLPWNVNLGGENNELRISPVTETDFSYNFFLATLDEGRPGKDNVVQKKGHRQLLMFSIEPIAIDMGPLYRGEEMTINVRNYVELPPHSVRYEWARVSGDFGVTRNLPSNMKLSRDGSALVIKEHQDYGAGDVTLTCAVYSNRNVTLARRNFFLRRIVSDKNPNPKVGSSFGAAAVRKRRFLDEFYVQGAEFPDYPENADLSPKSKRDALPPPLGEEANEWTETTTTTAAEFSEIGFDQEGEELTSQFSIVDKPKETVLNFYGEQRRPPPAEVSEFGQQPESAESFREQPQTLGELIHEANGIAGNEEEARGYSTARIVPTFEDRESMLIADCDRDSDCGINAACIRVEGSKRFCRCLPHYRGNGLFCWLF